MCAATQSMSLSSTTKLLSDLLTGYALVYALSALYWEFLLSVGRLPLMEMWEGCCWWKCGKAAVDGSVQRVLLMEVCEGCCWWKCWCAKAAVDGSVVAKNVIDERVVRLPVMEVWEDCQWWKCEMGLPSMLKNESLVYHHPNGEKYFVVML